MHGENPWLARRVIAYAHQGGAFEAPSSTLFAMRRALASGASAIELDVHMTRDGELVVCHDALVDRTTNGHGAIAQLTLAELRTLDNAYWFVPGHDAVFGLEPDCYPYRGRAPEDPELGIATLREVLHAFPGVVLNLDLKQTAPLVPPYEEPLARLLAAFTRGHDVIVASFHDAALERFRRLAPHIPTSAGMLGVAAFFGALRDGRPPAPPRVAAFQVPERYQGIEVVGPNFLEAAHRHGVAVHVWTVNDQARMASLVDLGVEGIISDRPSVLASTLTELTALWSPGDGAPTR